MKLTRCDRCYKDIHTADRLFQATYTELIGMTNIEVEEGKVFDLCGICFRQLKDFFIPLKSQK